MRALSSLGIGLAIVSSLLFLALVAQLYYIFWWKKRCSSSNSNPNFSSKNLNLLSLLCYRRRRRSSSSSPIHSPPTQHATPLTCNPTTDDLPLHLSSKDKDKDKDKDSLLKASINGEEAIDAELMRLHSLSGPPRFLFTIKEETREDLESDDGRSRGGRSRKGSRGRSLGDLLHCVESPFLTPLSSPPLLGMGAQSLVNFDSLKKLGFNPLFESCSTPPPKFKFLKEAEEKHQRRVGLLEVSREEGNGGKEGKSGDRERRQVSQVTVTPLPSSLTLSLSSIKTEK